MNTPDHAFEACLTLHFLRGYPESLSSQVIAVVAEVVIDADQTSPTKKDVKPPHSEVILCKLLTLPAAVLSCREKDDDRMNPYAHFDLSNSHAVFSYRVPSLADGCLSHATDLQHVSRRWTTLRWSFFLVITDEGEAHSKPPLLTDEPSAPARETTSPSSYLLSQVHVALPMWSIHHVVKTRGILIESAVGSLGVTCSVMPGPSQQDYALRLKEFFARFLPEKLPNAEAVILASESYAMRDDILAPERSVPEINVFSKLHKKYSKVIPWVFAHPGGTLQERVYDMFDVYDLGPIHVANALLEQWEGRELELLAVLCRDNGPEPSELPMNLRLAAFCVEHNINRDEFLQLEAHAAAEKSSSMLHNLIRVYGPQPCPATYLKCHQRVSSDDITAVFGHAMKRFTSSSVASTDTKIRDYLALQFPPGTEDTSMHYRHLSNDEQAVSLLRKLDAVSAGWPLEMEAASHELNQLRELSSFRFRPELQQIVTGLEHDKQSKRAPTLAHTESELQAAERIISASKCVEDVSLIIMREETAQWIARHQQATSAFIETAVSESLSPDAAAPSKQSLRDDDVLPPSGSSRGEVTNLRTPVIKLSTAPPAKPRDVFAPVAETHVAQGHSASLFHSPASSPTLTHHAPMMATSFVYAPVTRTMRSVEVQTPQSFGVESLKPHEAWEAMIDSIAAEHVADRQEDVLYDSTNSFRDTLHECLHYGSPQQFDTFCDEMRSTLPPLPRDFLHLERDRVLRYNLNVDFLVRDSLEEHHLMEDVCAASHGSLRRVQIRSVGRCAVVEHAVHRDAFHRITSLDRGAAVVRGIAVRSRGRLWDWITYRDPVMSTMMMSDSVTDSHRSAPVFRVYRNVFSAVAAMSSLGAVGGPRSPSAAAMSSMLVDLVLVDIAVGTPHVTPADDPLAHALLHPFAKNTPYRDQGVPPFDSVLFAPGIEREESFLVYDPRRVNIVATLEGVQLDYEVTACINHPDTRAAFSTAEVAALVGPSAVAALSQAEIFALRHVTPLCLGCLVTRAFLGTGPASTGPGQQLPTSDVFSLAETSPSQRTTERQAVAVARPPPLPAVAAEEVEAPTVSWEMPSSSTVVGGAANATRLERWRRLRKSSTASNRKSDAATEVTMQQPAAIQTSAEARRCIASAWEAWEAGDAALCSAQLDRVSSSLAAAVRSESAEARGLFAELFERHYHRACAAYRDSVSYNSENAEAWYRLGNLLQNQYRDGDEARNCFTAAAACGHALAQQRLEALAATSESGSPPQAVTDVMMGVVSEEPDLPGQQQPTLNMEEKHFINAAAQLLREWPAPGNAIALHNLRSTSIGDASDGLYAAEWETQRSASEVEGNPAPGVPESPTPPVAAATNDTLDRSDRPTARPSVKDYLRHRASVASLIPPVIAGAVQ